VAQIKAFFLQDPSSSGDQEDKYDNHDLEASPSKKNQGGLGASNIFGVVRSSIIKSVRKSDGKFKKHADEEVVSESTFSHITKHKRIQNVKDKAQKHRKVKGMFSDLETSTFAAGYLGTTEFGGANSNH